MIKLVLNILKDKLEQLDTENLSNPEHTLLTHQLGILGPFEEVRL